MNTHPFTKIALSVSIMTCFIFAGQSESLAQPKAKKASRITTPSARLKARASKSKQLKTDQESDAPKGGGKVIEFKQLSVEGTVQRPSASYFLQRRKLKFRGIEPRKSFISEIISSVKRHPF